MNNTNKIFLLLCFFFLFGCNDDIIDNNSKEGFWMKINNKTIANSEIEYYDFSTHTIYFKNCHSFFDDSDRGSFSIFIDDEEIYKGTIHPFNLSSLPTGLYISPTFSVKPQYTLSIECTKMLNAEKNEDPRNDTRIVNSLKAQGKYHAGLQFKISEINFLSDNQVSIDFQLSNPDSFDYLHLDPNKMGLGLFHYYTNGLVFFDNYTIQRYEPKLSVIKPEPYDKWEKKWMSVIQSGESKSFTIKYDFSNPVQTGKYWVFFHFPGLSSYQIDRKELNQKEGRIWLGGIETMIEYTK